MMSLGKSNKKDAEPANVPQQHTLQGEAQVSGIGLLLGEPVNVTIQPAPEGHGIVFERIDQDPPIQIPATIDNVTQRARRTTLRRGDVTIETIEHCMSALAGLRIDNALIRIDGPELPCGDGSALPFVEPILEVGIKAQDSPRRILKVSSPIMVKDGDAMIAAFPSDTAEFEVVFDLDYGDNTHRIKRQTQAFALRNGNFAEDISPARTYSLKEEAQALWDQGMCRHLSPKDVLVIGDDGPIENSYRFENEPVRHKIVDLLGDLYLSGAEIHGKFVAHKSGHNLNRRMCGQLVEQAQSNHYAELARGGQAMDIRTIQRLMPHRYPMLLVDRVLELDGDRRAVGVKNVTINEPFFVGHYPAAPIMPGVLLVEAMAQLGGLLVSQKLEHTGKIAILLSLDRVKLRKPVIPGDQVILEAEAIRAKATTANVKCRALVGNSVVAEAQVRFMLVDPDSA
jgi:UDP-3-O-[3-hydroxymyristoyl] N-acetylglucosamine deacetylase/3-hydroxyacyl-[acyl-carrier-protein] dehydratase